MVISTVPADTLLTLSQSSLTFNTVLNGTEPAGQQLTVSSQPATPFTATSATPWLSASPSGGLMTNQTLTVRVDPADKAVLQGRVGSFTSSILLVSGNVT